jgi:hypothetical protein
VISHTIGNWLKINGTAEQHLATEFRQKESRPKAANSLIYKSFGGGAGRNRTDDLRIAKVSRTADFCDFPAFC